MEKHCDSPEQDRHDDPEPVPPERPLFDREVRSPLRLLDELRHRQDADEDGQAREDVGRRAVGVPSEAEAEADAASDPGEDEAEDSDELLTPQVRHTPRVQLARSSSRETFGVEKLRDRIEGVEAEEVVALVTEAVEHNSARLNDVELRVDVLELGRDLTDEQLMWVALDERLSRLEEMLQRLLASC